ncbi:zonular occludens toxin domain-containing protein [Sulfurimonas sp. SWIR-19]|uniref:zonular occludens toxin domain-containing protein n=1 Tax=Sulfurimonas sp. SWIR-19 TaxID=2878390 RepID=UPI001CF4D344|nr:zonular occludens toxin domain-containing protein [Sulfurimonas sp. SWIR-19]UCM99200.1 zonular occludens toxin domain-containing protein [Sulfurimonas sp. SWIR-19]
MINLLVGLQGSGKTYYAVAEIWKHIKKMHQAEISGTTYKYKKIYTNIEGFTPNRYVETLDVARLQKIWEWELKQYKAYEDRHDYKAPEDINFETHNEEKKQKKDLVFNDPLLDIDLDEKRIEESSVDNIEIFDNNDQKLFESIKDPNATLDPEFIQYTLPQFEKEGFTHCLIIIDEAHNFFGGSGLKPAFKRLLSYHRHYHDQDYLLISQDHKMFNFAVTQLAAYSIRAINPIMRWRSDIFTYNIYSGGWISFSGDNKLETKSLKAKELIFNLYNSGGKKLQKSHFLKIMFKLFGGIAIMGLLFWFFLGDYGSKDKELVVETNKTKVAKKEKTEEEKKSTKIEKFLIVGNSIIHNKTGKKFQFDSFEKLLGKDDKPLTYNDNMDNTAIVYYQLTTKTLKNLGIGVKNEENSNSNFFTHGN